MSTIDRYPLQWPAGWPRAKERKRAKFSTASYSAPTSFAPGKVYRSGKQLSVADGVERVFAELSRMGVWDWEIVVSSNVALGQRGFPLSKGGEPADPGVAVYWSKGNGPRRVMAIDIYDRAADNLAAIAATLDALRAIERHGGAVIGDRAFTGFDALPPPPDCWKTLGLGAGASADAIDAAYRNLARKAHPDAGGSDDAMARLNVARDEALRLISLRT